MNPHKLSPCRRCGCIFECPIEIPSPNTPHEAKLTCPDCDGFVGWKAKEKNLDKRPKNKYLPSDLNIDYCELCRRERQKLGLNETLISHHKNPIEEGGIDEPVNILVLCSACHSWVHWGITYLRDHWRDR